MRGYVLEYSRDPDQKAFFRLEGEETLGRSSVNTITLVDPAVSRRHAKLTFTRGRWILHDLGSRNGTYVNNSRIKRQALNHGDAIRMGNLMMRFLQLDTREKMRPLLEQTQESMEMDTPSVKAEGTVRLDIPRELQDQIDMAGTFLSALPVGAAILNREMRVRHHNRSFPSLRSEEDRYTGKCLGPFLRCGVSSEKDFDCGVFSKCTACPLRVATREAFEHDAFTRGKEITWPMLGEHPVTYIRFSLLPLYSRIGGEALALLTWEDITHRMHAEEQLKHDASHDALTGLSNRLLFMDRLKHSIDQVKRRDGYLFAVLYVDLDHFKLVNDGFGHAVGDQVLVETANRLKASLRSVDSIARLGGDEFTILLDGIKDAQDAVYVVEKIQKRLKSPIHSGAQEILTTASIGVVICKKGDEQPDEMVRKADMAMYRAKYLGRDRYVLFDQLYGMHGESFDISQFEADLRRAIRQQEFVAHYQPFVAAETGHATGVEALLRWKSAKHGLVSPGEFIQLAEETGLIVPIGELMLRKACRQNRAWQVAGFPSIRIAVNLSPRQFRQKNLLEIVKKALRDTGLAPHLLELEITERAVMENVNTSIKTLQGLHEIGVRISIDDFGTGYSSLPHLKRLPIDTIKIDSSLVTDIDTNPDNAAIVMAVVAMAQNMNIRVVAEGVENREQMDFLCSIKCDEMQGYLFGRPTSAKAFSDLLSNRSGKILPFNRK